MKKIGLILGYLLAALSFPANAKENVVLDEIIVEATRSDEKLKDVTRNITIITREEIKNSVAKTLPELLSKKTGIYVSNYLSSPKGVNIGLRGFGEASASNLLVLIDGRRTNQVDLSGVDWGQINLNTVERIEIIRGGGSVLYGDNATAGVINIITQKLNRSDQKPSVEVGIEVGSYQYHGEYTNIAGSLDKWSYLFHYARKQTTGFRANDEYWSNDFLSNISYYPNDEWEIDFSTGHHRDRYGLAGALFPGNLNKFGRRGSKDPINNGMTSDSFVSATPKHYFEWSGKDAEFSMHSSFRRRKNKSNNGTFDTVNHIQSYEIQPKLKIQLEEGDSYENQLTVGVDFFQADNIVRSGTQGSADDHVSIEKRTLGLYVLDEMKWNEQWLMNAGVRGVIANYDFDQKSVVPNYEHKWADEGAFNIGLGYKYHPSSQVYFDFSRSFRFPATDEFYVNRFDFGGGPGGGLTTSLRQQVAYNYELGFRDRQFDDFSVNMNLFLMDIKDELYYNPTTFANTNYDADTRHLGVEADATYSLFDGLLEPYIHWTLQESFFKGGTFSGSQIPMTPKAKVVAGVTLRPFDDFQTSLSAIYAGKRYVISDQSNVQSRLDSYLVYDWTASYEYENMSVWIAVNNLLDHHYNDYAALSTFPVTRTGVYPARERNFQAGVSWKF